MVRVHVAVKCAFMKMLFRGLPFVLAALAVHGEPDVRERSRRLFYNHLDNNQDEALSRDEINGILTSTPAKAKGIDRA